MADGFHLSEVIDHPEIQSAIANLSERVANHACSAQTGAVESAQYHEHADEFVGEAVDSMLRHTELDSYAAWADGYDLEDQLSKETA